MVYIIYHNGYNDMLYGLLTSEACAQGGDDAAAAANQGEDHATTDHRGTCLLIGCRRCFDCELLFPLFFPLIRPLFILRPSSSFLVLPHIHLSFLLLPQVNLRLEKDAARLEERIRFTAELGTYLSK